MPVSLGHTQIDRQVRAAGKTYLVVQGNVPAPIRFGQTIYAQLPAKAATVEHDSVVGECRKIDRPDTMLVSMPSSPPCASSSRSMKLRLVTMVRPLR
jgi:hypothetical protein